MIDPNTVMVATPSYDYKYEDGYVKGLQACADLFRMRMTVGGTEVRLARNLLANGFRRIAARPATKEQPNPIEWLVFIDADIGFSRLDFALLMDYVSPTDHPHPDPSLVQHATQCMPTANPQVAEYDLVNAEYSQKDEARKPVRFGLGFTRIHVSVFDAIDAVNNEDGSQKVDTFPWQGHQVTDYFLSGSLSHRWYSEDRGFFELARLAGITPKIECRTKLEHWGRACWKYEDTNQGGGQ